MALKVKTNTNAALKNLRDDLNVRVLKSGHEVRNTLVEKVLVGNRTGNEYNVPNTQVRYRASRAGEAPATATGDLRRSYAVKHKPEELLVAIGSPLKYAVYLEKGTKNMDARPHLSTAFIMSKNIILEILKGKI